MLNLTFRLVLRYLLSGAVAICVYYLSLYGLEIDIKEIKNEMPGFEILFALALVVGAIIYGLHRSLIYWLLFYWWLVKLSWGKLMKPDELDMFRWKLRLKDKSILSKITDWTDQVHSLYCVSWGCLVGLLVAKFDNSTIDDTGWVISWIIFAILLIAAMVDNYRYLLREKGVIKEECL